MSESASLSRDQVARLTARLERVGAVSASGEIEAPAHAALPELGIIFFSGLTRGLEPFTKPYKQTKAAETHARNKSRPLATRATPKL